MTDINDHDDDEMRAYVRHLFDSGDDAPPDDIVDRGKETGLTREDLLRQNELAGWGEVTVPGKVDFDNDGIPNYVGPSTTEVVHRDTVVYRSVLVRLGMTEDDVPNIKVIDDPPERQQDQ